MKTMDLSEKIRTLYAIVNDLEAAFPGRRFTPDGHMIGSIGEVVAAEMFDLDLLPNSSAVHDATAHDGRLVQIKTTQRDRIALSACPQHLLVLQINDTGSWNVVYNGPGEPAWERTGKMQKNGQRPIKLPALESLMTGIDERDRLMQVK